MQRWVTWVLGCAWVCWRACQCCCCCWRAVSRLTDCSSCTAVDSSASALVQPRDVPAQLTDLTHRAARSHSVLAPRHVLTPPDLHRAQARVPHSLHCPACLVLLPAQACELFILDLTIRGWVHAEDSRRRTLTRADIAATIAHWEVLDFLVRAGAAAVHCRFALWWRH